MKWQNANDKKHTKGCSERPQLTTNFNRKFFFLWLFSVALMSRKNNKSWTKRMTRNFCSAKREWEMNNFVLLSRHCNASFVPQATIDVGADNDDFAFRQLKIIDAPLRTFLHLTSIPISGKTSSICRTAGDENIRINRSKRKSENNWIDQNWVNFTIRLLIWNFFELIFSITWIAVPFLFDVDAMAIIDSINFLKLITSSPRHFLSLSIARARSFFLFIWYFDINAIRNGRIEWMSVRLCKRLALLWRFEHSKNAFQTQQNSMWS